ncbi:MAG: hypothetical protein Q4E53_13135 [Eubacteriales bacterium]|nr:hypothetical protein [Eubacteriales bacterium]
MKEFVFAVLPWIIIGLVLIVYFVKRKSPRSPKQNEKVTDYSTEGMCMGICFGCAIGATNVINIGSAISLGMLVGLTIGMLIKKEDSGNNDD